MNLKKWSPLRSNRSDVFRTLEDNYNSLQLPVKQSAEQAEKTETALPTRTAAVLPSCKPPTLRNPRRAG